MILIENFDGFGKDVNSLNSWVLHVFSSSLIIPEFKTLSLNCDLIILPTFSLEMLHACAIFREICKVV